MTIDPEAHRTAQLAEVLSQADRVHRAARILASSEDDAAELTQETLVRACQGWTTYRRWGEPFTWLYGILLNTWRAGRRRPQPGSLAEEPVARELDPASQLIQGEGRNLVRLALSRLRPVEREVLALYYTDELPVARIAEVLTIPAGTVKSRLHRARTALGRELVGLGWEE